MQHEQTVTSEIIGLKPVWDALNRDQAVLRLKPDGLILQANRRFLDLVGYEARDLIGRYHDTLCCNLPDSLAADAALWARLRRGESETGDYMRLTKAGQPVWLRTTFSPVTDAAGLTAEVLCIASDITSEKLQQAELHWQIAAIHKSHLVITFDMDGLILDANQDFLDAVGYGLDEIVGRHHRMFVEGSHAHSAEYATFWRQLAAGRHQTGQFRRVAKDGSEIWLQATYNPVFDIAGKPVKVVKYAVLVTDEKLRQAEHQGQIAAIHKALCVISFDLNGTIIDANDNFLEATGYRLADIKGKPHRMFVELDHAASEEYALFWRNLAMGHHQAGEYRRLGKNGRELWLHATYNSILDLNGRPFRVIKYATVITAQKLQRADFEGQITAIRKSQGVIAFNLDGTILDVNDNFAQVVGYTPEELRSQHHRLLMAPEEASNEDYHAFWVMLRDGHFVSGLYKRRHRDGSAVWIQASYNPILGLDGKPSKIIKIATDVTSNVALAEAYEDARRQAQHDPATALPNRVRLLSFMHSVMSQVGRRLVVLYIDLDRFKPVNDTFGHQVGDQVLGQVADRLRRTLAPEQLAARVGGDEFVIAAPDLTDEETEALCQRLLGAVSEPIPYAGNELRMSMCIGVATSGDGETPDELLRCADVAMYRAKQVRSGSFSFYASELNERLLAYRTMVEDIRQGLQDGEFFLEYQPRYETLSRRMRSAEALVRWNHPRRGRISPGDFVPAAERSGLIVALGEWVMLEACRTAATWPEIGVSVNVSPVQFQASDIVSVVRRVLKETGLRPDRLELEITEGTVLADAARAHTALKQLKAIGVGLAMDDFGTGYSSLSTLRAFPFDVIKIDRQFIQDMDTRDSGREVVQAVLGLARALGLSATAEGVETCEQLDMLSADRCAEVQGFLLSRPVAASRLLAILREDGAELQMPRRRTKRVRQASRALSALAAD